MYIKQRITNLQSLNIIVLVRKHVKIHSDVRNTHANLYYYIRHSLLMPIHESGSIQNEVWYFRFLNLAYINMSECLTENEFVQKHFSNILFATKKYYTNFCENQVVRLQYLYHVVFHCEIPTSQNNMRQFFYHFPKVKKNKHQNCLFFEHNHSGTDRKGEINDFKRVDMLTIGIFMKNSV